MNPLLQRESATAAFFNKHGLLAKRFDLWRVLPREEQVSGHINALPASVGYIRATDGVLCAIENDQGNVYIGHIGWWIPDAKEPSGGRKTNRAAQQILEMLGY